MRAHYHDADAVPIIGGWACYCDHPETRERPASWREIRSEALSMKNKQIQLPRLGSGIYVRIEQDGTERVAVWDQPEDADAAMTAAGIDP